MFQTRFRDETRRVKAPKGDLRCNVIVFKCSPMVAQLRLVGDPEIWGAKNRYLVLQFRNHSEYCALARSFRTQN